MLVLLVLLLPHLALTTRPAASTSLLPSSNRTSTLLVLAVLVALVVLAALADHGEDAVALDPILDLAACRIPLRAGFLLAKASRLVHLAISITSAILPALPALMATPACLDRA